MRAGWIILGLLGWSLPQSKAPPASGEDWRPLRLQVAAQDSPVAYQAQLLGELDRPVGDGVRLESAFLPARVNDKGALELDVHNDGKPRLLTGRREIVSVPVSGEGDKPKTMTLKLEFHKREDGAWVYRNLTVLHVQIGPEQFVIVDANANGTYNDPREDGMAWEGHSWLFPLPGSSEAWCSATLEFTGLEMGPLGEHPTLRGRPLATTVPAALAILKGVNDERVQIGLTPRPEDPQLSAQLQKHCSYMAQNNVLTHPEDPGKPGYSPEGNQAGLRSILGRGQAGDQVAAGMVSTYFHRQDVIRPGTLAFGLGIEGAFTGIDGRTRLGQTPAGCWPVLCPVPGQTGVGTTYAKEAPDATPGDPSAGYPITAYFGTSDLKLRDGTLKALPPGAAQLPRGAKLPPGTPVECYLFDPGRGASPDMTRFQAAVCLIPKDPLRLNVDYEVSLSVDVAGKPWSKTWRFSTAPGHSPKDRLPGR